jgi:CrcB protein
VTRRPLSPLSLLAVAVGGATGALARWVLGELSPDGSGFPWTTFAINVCGAFLLAALPAVAAVRDRSLLALALGPGLLGGFTTLSAYAAQGRGLLDDGRPGLALTYLVGTLAACLVAVTVAHRLSTPDEQLVFDDEEGNE